MRKFYLCCILVLSVCTLGMQGSIDTPQETVIVPNVKGVTLEIAAKSLQAVGLQAWFQGSSDLSAIVVRQVPQAGLELPIGGEVILLADSTVKTTLNVLGTESRGQTPFRSEPPAATWTASSVRIGRCRRRDQSRLATTSSARRSWLSGRPRVPRLPLPSPTPSPPASYRAPTGGSGR